MANIPDVYSIQNICRQRQRRQLYNIQPSRFTPTNPYPLFTQFQLNMRRKAEILKYDTTNSKTNKITGKQLFSQSMKTSSNQNSRTTCSVNKFLPTPTTSCDVPGPPIVLYQDPAVPLYNYQSSIIRSYGIENTAVSAKQWDLFITTDISLSPIVSGYYPFFTILFLPVCDVGYWLYSCQCSMQLLFSGTTPTSTSLKFTVSKLYVDVYYTDVLVCSSDAALVPTAWYKTPIVVTTDYTIVDDTIANMQIETVAGQRFNVLFYSGFITLSDMTLPTQPGFIYDVRLRPQFTVTSPSTVYNIATQELIINCSNDTTTVEGCTLMGYPSRDTFTEFLFSRGVSTSNLKPIPPYIAIYDKTFISNSPFDFIYYIQPDDPFDPLATYGLYYKYGDNNLQLATCSGTIENGFSVLHYYNAWIPHVNQLLFTHYGTESLYILRKTSSQIFTRNFPIVVIQTRVIYPVTGGTIDIVYTNDRLLANTTYLVKLFAYPLQLVQTLTATTDGNKFLFLTGLTIPQQPNGFYQLYFYKQDNTFIRRRSFYYVAPNVTKNYSLTITNPANGSIVMIATIQIVNSYVVHFYDNRNPTLDILLLDNLNGEDHIWDDSIPNFTLGGINISLIPYFSPQPSLYNIYYDGTKNYINEGYQIFLFSPLPS